MTVNGVNTPEYTAWSSMLTRCYAKTFRNDDYRYHWYKNVTVCDDWLLFENFYEWLHSQENFDKWFNGDKWCVDKDILVKGNKIYSPDTCCLVPNNVNTLFVKSNSIRGKYPIGVAYKSRDKIFEVQCNVNSKETYLGRANTAEKAFQIYKNFKESLIKQTALKEYSKNNIIKRCYEAMMNYEVEITD